MCGTECVAPAVQCTSGCVDVQTDAANCGQCARVCPNPNNATAVCTNGACGSICNAGYSRCGGNCVDTNTNKQHCGTCGNKCMGNAMCVGGFCTYGNRD
jgi:hypothetical protein